LDFASSGVIAIMGLKSPAENESSQIYGSTDIPSIAMSPPLPVLH
jgi:hypothetical protein